MAKRPQQHLFHLGQGRRAHLDAVPPLERRLAQFLAQHRRIDSQLLRRIGGKLVPRQLLRHSPDVRQQEVHRLHLLLRARSGKHLPRPLDQVVGLRARPAHRLRIGFHAPLANIPVRVQAAVQGHNPDRESLLRQQRDRLLRGVGPGGVGIEVDHHVRSVPLEDRHLLLGEGRPAGRDHVLNPAQKDRNAVHLAFHQQRKPGLPDHAARLVQIEQHLALRVERRLRRIDVLGPGFLAGFERARGKGDHPPALVRDREHDPLAKAVVERALGPVARAPWS